jgi:hypothetical protein
VAEPLVVPRRPWLVIVALIVAGLAVGLIFRGEQFRSCVGGICDAIRATAKQDSVRAK